MRACANYLLIYFLTGWYIVWCVLEGVEVEVGVEVGVGVGA